MEAQKSKTTGLKWFVALAIPILVYLIPMGERITGEMKWFFVITLWAILMFMFELLDNATISVAMVFGYALLKVVPIETALSAWTNTTIWMVFASLPQWRRR